VRKKGEGSPFIRKTLISGPPLKPHPRGCGPASARAHGHATRVHARPRGHGSAGTRIRADVGRPRVHATSTRAQVHARRDPRPHGRTNASAQTRFLPRLRTVKTRPRDKHGHGRTYGRKGRPDGHFHPKTSVMTTLHWWPKAAKPGLGHSLCFFLSFYFIFMGSSFCRTLRSWSYQ
jgi:hypothetical protein